MTNQEFSNTFDTLIASYVRDTLFGNTDPFQFDDYEKSVFLTQAQEELIISIYNGKNSNGEAFENSEESRRYLASLVKTKIDNTTDSSSNRISNKSYMYKLESDCWFIIYESVDWYKKDTGCIPYTNIQVTPTTHDEYHKIKNNPFRGANNIRVLRLDVRQKDTNDILVELISKYPISTYYYRYITKPNPIIISTLPDNLAINGISQESSCQLHEALHNKILQLAVTKAIQSRGIAQQSNQ